MILDSVGSFIDNIKTKVSNPFFGTLITVWLVRNWHLIYGIFIFDSDCKMNDKFQFVQNHFKTKSVYYELLTNIFITFGLLILGYVLLIISRFLANLVEHRITPNLNRIAASNLVANKDVLTELETQLLKKTNDLINERKLVNELQLQLVEIRNRVDLEVSEKKSVISQLSEQTRKNREEKSRNEILETRKNTLSEDLNEIRTMCSDVRKLNSLCEKIHNENNIAYTHIDCYLNLWSFNLVSEFAKIVSDFDKGSKKYKTSQTNNSLLKILKEKEIIKLSLNSEEKNTTLTYTELGEEFTQNFFQLKKDFKNHSLFW